jgi:hypothetical protein
MVRFHRDLVFVFDFEKRRMHFDNLKDISPTK